MIFGIGTDIIELDRISKLISRGRPYLEDIFTDSEIEYCEGKARKSQHYGARYAAKEAVLKALGGGWRDGLAFRDIEVIDDEWGKPQVLVRGKVKVAFERHQIKQALISLSHSKHNAIAVIILEQ